MNSAKFLRTPFFIDQLRCLLLKKICCKESFAKLPRKHLRSVACNLIKRDSHKVIFLRILRNLSENIFYRAAMSDWFSSYKKKQVCNFLKQQPEVFCEKVFLKISQISQENSCAEVSFLITLQIWGLKFAKFLRTPILKNICERLLLNYLAAWRCSEILQIKLNKITERIIWNPFW